MSPRSSATILSCATSLILSHSSYALSLLSTFFTPSVRKSSTAPVIGPARNDASGGRASAVRRCRSVAVTTSPAMYSLSAWIAFGFLPMGATSFM